MFNLLLDSIMLMPRIFVRAFPVALLLGALYFGMITNTDNPFWQSAFAVMLAFPFIAIMRVAALRAGLVAIGRTGPPTLSNLMRSQLRIAYGNLLPIYIVLVMLIGLVATYLAQTFFDSSVLDVALSGQTDQLNERMLEAPMVLLGANILYILLLAIGFGIMGTPMAVTCANAAEKNPRHDITFGFAFNFWSLVVLYLVGNTLNTIVMLTLGLFLLALTPVVDPQVQFYVLIVAGLVYVSMCFAVTAGGAAISYGQLLDREAQIREYVQAAIAGEQTTREDLRAMRQKRQTGGN